MTGLEHLASYLPYGLMLKTETGIIKLLSLDTVLKMVNFGHGDAKELSEIKLILHPLSDLTKEVEINGIKVIPDSESFNLLGGRFLSTVLKDNGIETLPYNLIQKLFEWHFDVSGLIEEGLAIDYNEVNTI
jgi:hypothetical protein